MIYLLLSILCSAFILIVFKISARKNFPPLLLVIINYFSATFLGYYLSNTTPWQSVQVLGNHWLPIVIIGSIYILAFFLMGETTKRSGIAVTTIASKMSFVIPVVVSFMIDPNDSFSIKKAVIVIATIIAVVLSVYKKDDSKSKSWLLPLLLFVLIGFSDSLIKYMQTFHVKDSQTSSLFTATLFTVSGLIGIVAWAFYGPKRKLIFKPLALIGGLLLGVANFGSIYFLINALNSINFNSSMVLGMNNLGVVVLSILIAVFIFKEKMLKINKIGVLLSLLIVVLMMISF